MVPHSPQIGSWYESAYLEAIFEVVAIDEDHGTIEIQYDSGDIDELELDEWQTARFLPAAPPDDAHAGYGTHGDDFWDDDLQLENPLLDETDRYDLNTFADFEDI